MNPWVIAGLLIVGLSPAAMAAAPANLLANGDFANGLRGWQVSGGERCRAEVFAANVAGLAKAVRLNVRHEPGTTPWSVAMRQSVDAFMGKGDRLLLQVWMRSPERCKLSAYLEIGKEPYTKSISKHITLTPQWREYRVEGKCLQNFSPAEAQFGFHLGYSTGAIEIAGIRLFDLDHRPGTAGARPTVDGPQSLIANGDFSQPLKGNWGTMDGERVQSQLIDAEAGPYKKALRLVCRPKPDSDPWSIQVGQKCQGYVRRGEAIYFRAWLRSPDRCRISFIYELGEAPHSKSVSQMVTLKPEWKEYRFMGRARQGFRSGQSQAKFFLGYDPGTVEIAGVRVENYGRAKGHAFDQTIDYWAGQTHTDAWRQPALERIERIRKGELAVTVVDGAGRPVSGATVRVEQKRHGFRFGTAVPAARLVDRANPDNLRFQRELERLYNTVVFENDLKWRSYSEGRLQTVTKAIEWLHARDIAVRGHCLLWGRYRHIPPPHSKLRGEALRRSCEKHVTDYATRMRGKLYVWDVVNEARSNVEVWDDIGWESFADSFRWARAADPKVRLCYNDYAIVNHPGKAKDGAAERIRYLLDHGAPVDVLGIQAHMSLPLTPIDQVLKVLDEWAAFGKSLEITEFDLSCTNDQVHAAYVRDFMTAVFSHPGAAAFVMWGFWEGSHWRSDEGGAMFRLDWTPRPAQAAYEDLVFKQWWTRWQGRTDRDGTAKLRAFYGKHDVRVEAGGRRSSVVVELTRSAPGQARVVLK